MDFHRSTVRFLTTSKFTNLRTFHLRICNLQLDAGELSFTNNDDNPSSFIFERCFGHIYSKISIQYNYTAKAVSGYLIQNSGSKVLMNNSVTININAHASSTIHGFGLSRTTLDIDAGSSSTTTFTTNCSGVLYNIVFGTVLNTHQNIVMNGSSKNICFNLDQGFNVANVFDTNKVTLNGGSRYTNIATGVFSSNGQFIRTK